MQDKKFLLLYNFHTLIKMPTLTISTQLLSGTLDGPRIVQSFAKLCSMYISPRDVALDIAGRHIPRKHCLYILVGETEQGEPKAYIGQTRDFQRRVREHLANKSFWNTAIVFISRADGIYASEVEYLEYYAILKANEAGSYNLDENIQTPAEPSLAPEKKIEMEQYFEEIKFFLSFLGTVPIFERRGRRRSRRTPIETHDTPQAAQPASPTNATLQPLIASSDLIPIHPDTNLPDKAQYTLDGETTFDSLRSFVFYFMKRFLQDNPSITYPELKELFPTSLLTGYKYCGTIATPHEIEASTIKEEKKITAYHYGDTSFLLGPTGDNVRFYITTQWMRESFKHFLAVVEACGYQVYIKR